MIVIGSTFKVSDNSGVKKILSIGILDKSCIKLCVGNFIVGSVKIGKLIKSNNDWFSYSRNVTLKSSIFKFFIVKSKKIVMSYTNSGVYSCFNSVIVLGRDRDVITGKKVVGLMSYIVKKIFYKSRVNLKNAKFIV